MSKERILSIEHKRAEESLRESEQWLATILKSIGDAIITTDNEGIVTFMNPVAEALTGWKHGEAFGKDIIFKIIHEKTPPPADDPAEKTLQGDIVINITNYPLLIARDGTEIPIEYSGAPIKDDKGNISGVVLVIHDITERKLAEQALRASEEKLRKILEASPDAITVTDLNGNIIECNTATILIHSFSSKEEIIGKKHLDLIAPKDRSRAARNMKKTLEQGLIRNLEYTLLTKNGREFSGELSASVILDSDDNPLAFVEITKDITERKQAEEVLRENEARLQSIFRAAPIGIGLVSNRILLQVNDRICEMLGYSSDELIGKSTRILYPTAKDFDYVGRERYRQIRERGTGIIETHWRLKDDTVIDVLLSSTPIDPFDLSVGITFTALDITERKRVEEELRKHREHLKDLVEERTTELQREIEERKQMEQALAEERNLLRTLIDNLPDYIYVKDRESRFLLANKASMCGLGIATLDELVGKTDFDFFPRELAEQYYGDEQAIFESGQPLINREERNIDLTTGIANLVLTTKVPLRDSQGHIVGIVGIGRNITEHKRMDEELQKT